MFIVRDNFYDAIYVSERGLDMKTPKQINSKRASLWKGESRLIRAFYPSGHVEFYDPYFGSWLYSYYSDPDPEMAIQDLKTDNKFLGYL